MCKSAVQIGVWRVVVAEGVVATGLRARTREGIKGGIGMGLEKHTGWAEE